MKSLFNYAPPPIPTRGQGVLKDTLIVGSEVFDLSKDYVWSWPLSLQNTSAFESVAY